MEIDRWRGKTAIVTGAGSGIGAAIMKALLSKGINVAGLDIKLDDMKNIHAQIPSDSDSGKFYPIRCDVSRGNEISTAFQEAERELGGVDIMINNAGVINYKKIIDSDRSTFEKLVNTNFLGYATCTREAVRSMRVRNVEGHIFNINSVLGHEIPDSALSDTFQQTGFNLYPACKHATVAMTHSVRREIMTAKLPIRVTSISPGVVKTEIARSAGLHDLFDRIPALIPEDIADGLLYALGTRPEVQVTEITIRRTGEL